MVNILFIQYKTPFIISQKAENYYDCEALESDKNGFIEQRLYTNFDWFLYELKQLEKHIYTDCERSQKRHLKKTKTVFIYSAFTAILLVL
ncbi:hypothetical protein [Gilliamella sp. Lep-s35]|uniref:hypothetical protein n=1 Tax=Gilliamella sp. Lep-s35 TaxID=2687312 RepID=UPI0013664DE4|nr:hypothetical protein [Gilliamella sp. Lep-s35]